MKAIHNTMANNDPLRSPLGDLLEGRYRRAIRRYQAGIETNPDASSQFELACAQAAVGLVTEAEEALGRWSQEGIPPDAKPRYETAMAYLSSAHGNQAGCGEHLAAAVKADSGFPLAHLSYGRHLLWTERNLDAARVQFDLALRNAPHSIAPLLNLLAVDVETGEFSRARRCAWSVVARHPFALRPWLMALGATLMGSPWDGRLVLAIVGLGVFLPYVGPILFVTWIAFALASYAALRRLSPRLAVNPGALSLALMLVFGARLVIWRGVYP